MECRDRPLRMLKGITRWRAGRDKLKKGVKICHVTCQLYTKNRNVVYCKYAHKKERELKGGWTGGREM